MSNLVPNFLKKRLNNASGYTKEKEEEDKRMKDINAQIEKLNIEKQKWLKKKKKKKKQKKKKVKV